MDNILIIATIIIFIVIIGYVLFYYIRRSDNFVYHNFEINTDKNNIHNYISDAKKGVRSN